jgi:DNA-binding CsgD family transcriptional regulator
LVVETMVFLNRASRYEEAQQLADGELSAEVSQESEAEILLRLAAGIEDPEGRIAENRRALQLRGINDVTRARHRAWLAYFETVNGMHTDASVSIDAAAAATATGDLEARIVSETALGMLDLQEGFPLRAVERMESVDALSRTGESTFGHIIASVHRVRLVVTLGRLDDASALVTACTEQARRDGYAMALPPLAILAGMVHAAGGRLAAARAAIEALPTHEWGNVTENNMMRMLILSDVAVRTDDRTLLQQLVNEARSLCSSASPLLSCGAAYVLAVAAWHRGDIHEAVRWLGGQHTHVITPLWLNVFDQLILMSRVASATGDAGLRSRVMQSIEVLERERPGTPLFAAIAAHTRGILDRDADELSEVANVLRSWRPLLYAGATEDAGGEFARTQRKEQAIEHLNAAFDTFVKCEAVADARRVGRALRKLGVERRIVAPTRGKSGWDSLTDAELKVVNMIAQGASNREVAAQLHLSPHTVKAHLRNAFAKLGVNSRSQLSRPGS